MKIKQSKNLYNQKMQEFKINIPIIVDINLNKIDNWLNNILKVEIPPYPYQKTNILKKEENIFNLSYRVLLLSTTLLQAIDIPVFDIGEITNINKNKENSELIITMNIASIEHIPQNVYTSVISASLNVLLNYSKKDTNYENIINLFNIIESDIITAFKYISGSGKSTLQVLKKAHEKNIPFIHLTNGIYQLGYGSNSTKINRSIIQSDSAIGAQMSQNKLISSMMLRNAGFPTPIHSLATNYNEALLIAKNLTWPVVIKPADMDRGEGITIDITDEHLLKKAFDYAYQISNTKQIIVEKQVKGTCHRVFIAKNKMLYAVKRLPKFIITDGINSIKNLIEISNKKELSLPPWKREKIVPIDETTQEIIRNLGYSESSIPKKDEIIPLRKIESTRWGGENEDVTHTIHPKNIEIAIKASKLFALDVVGIDIITPDIKIPWYENGAIINEVNFSPLLGGSDISRRNIPKYLDTFVKDNGHIKISLFIGDNSALKKAYNLQEKELNDNIKSFITTHNKTICNNKEEIIYPFNSLYQRINALLFDNNVDSIIIVLQTDEFLYTNLPINYINYLDITNKNIYSFKNTSEKISNKRFEELENLTKTIMYS